MKADLAQNWVEMALMPVIVDDEYMDQYAAYLLGHEIAGDYEFAELARHVRTIGSVRGCKFALKGSCFHPFRPYSLVEGIFSECLGKHAKSFTSEGVEDALQNRMCDRPCPLGCADSRSNALFGISKMYAELFDMLSSAYGYFVSFADFKNGRACWVDGEKLDLGDLQKYEDNVRAHFWKLFERHYGIASKASDAGTDELSGDGQSDWRSRSYRAGMQIRFELVTHCQTYWKAGKYKEHES